MQNGICYKTGTAILHHILRIPIAMIEEPMDGLQFLYTGI